MLLLYIILYYNYNDCGVKCDLDMFSLGPPLLDNYYPVIQIQNNIFVNDKHMSAVHDERLQRNAPIDHVE